MSNNNTAEGLVLAATTVASGVTVLPETGQTILGSILTITAITCGSIVLLNAVIVRLIKHVSN